MNWSLLISLGSLIVAVISLIKSFFTDRKAKRLDLILKEKNVAETIRCEENNKKADLEANVIDTQYNKPNVLCIYNKGEHEAENIRMEIIGDNNNDSVQLRIRDNYFPYPKLLPQQNFNIPYICFSNLPHHTVKLTWDDAFKKGRVKEIVLDL